MSAILFAYSPAVHSMVRERRADVEVNGRIDELVAAGFEVSVAWLAPDPAPTVDELLDGLDRRE